MGSVRVYITQHKKILIVLSVLAILGFGGLSYWFFATSKKPVYILDGKPYYTREANLTQPASEEDAPTPEEQIQALETRIADGEKTYPTYLAVGQLYLQTENYSKALEYYRLARGAVDPNIEYYESTLAMLDNTIDYLERNQQ